MNNESLIVPDIKATDGNEENNLTENTVKSINEKRCPNCQALCEDDQIFCPECGASLKKLCAKCGAELHDDQMFCPKCGTNACETMHNNSEAVSQYNMQQLKKSKKKSVFIILFAVLAIFGAVFIKFIAPVVFITPEELMLQGDYKKAYEKAEEKDMKSMSLK